MMTIAEIARLAGVSRGTVDRVVNNRGSVSEENRNRILKIIEANGFVPNKAGKTLAIRKKSLKLGFLLFNTTNNPFFLDVEKGIDRFIGEYAPYGVEVLRAYCSLSDEADTIRAIDHLVDEGIHGLAITPIDSPLVDRRIRELQKTGIPVVTVNSDLPTCGRLSYVGSDYKKAGETAAGMMGLLMHGQGKVGILIGSSSVLCHTQRECGFREVLNARFSNMEITSTLQGQDDDQISYQKVKTLLEIEQPNALYLAAAGTEGALRAVQESGRSLVIVAHDVSPAIRKALQQGELQVAIDQNPLQQGKKPLEILFEYLGFSTIPEPYHYTKSTIVIQENLEQYI